MIRNERQDVEQGVGVPPDRKPPGTVHMVGFVYLISDPEEIQRRMKRRLLPSHSGSRFSRVQLRSTTTSSLRILGYVKESPLASCHVDARYSSISGLIDGPYSLEGQRNSRRYPYL
jgi:hypothetical protein